MKNYLPTEALSKRARIFEQEVLKKIQIDQASISTLQSLFLDVYALLLPRSIDYENRRLLIQVFNKMVVDTFGNNNSYLSVEAFGSFVMDLFTASSDLDLTIHFSDGTSDYPRHKMVFALRKLASVLGVHQRNGLFKGLSQILEARVPILKIVDNKSGIECDISVEGKDGVSRSQFFKLVNSIDDRFKILCYLMKLWAKEHGINSARDQTMNSLSIVTLVAFHFQTRKPPIFPPFSSLLKDGLGMSNVERNVAAYENFGKNNLESVAELFITLLAKLASVNRLWRQGLCASTYEGRWISKLWNSRAGKMTIGNMNVEDFVKRSENFSRCVGKAKMNKILMCIENTLDHLLSFTKGKIEASELKQLLFKSKELDASGKLPIQKVILSKYPSVDLTKRKSKNKAQKKKFQKTLEVTTINSNGQRKMTTNYSNDREEVGQKRKQPMTDFGVSKRARNIEPARVTFHYPAPVSVLVPPMQPQFSNVFYRPGPTFIPPQPLILPHQFHNQVPLVQSSFLPQPSQRPLAGYFSVPQQPLAPAYRVHYSQYNQNLVPYQNLMFPGTSNGDAYHLPRYRR